MFSKYGIQEKPKILQLFSTKVFYSFLFFFYKWNEIPSEVFQCNDISIIFHLSILRKETRRHFNVSEYGYALPYFLSNRMHQLQENMLWFCNSYANRSSTSCDHVLILMGGACDITVLGIWRFFVRWNGNLGKFCSVFGN